MCEELEKQPLLVMAGRHQLLRSSGQISAAHLLGWRSWSVYSAPSLASCRMLCSRTSSFGQLPLAPGSCGTEQRRQKSFGARRERQCHPCVLYTGRRLPTIPQGTAGGQRQAGRKLKAYSGMQWDVCIVSCGRTAGVCSPDCPLAVYVIWDQNITNCPTLDLVLTLHCPTSELRSYFCIRTN